MEDLTQYTDDELSLRVFNDEGLYNIRHTAGLADALDSLFIYTNEQLSVLQTDLRGEES